jgi:hypothetical protein
MNSVLITSTAKKFLHQIENFRKSSIYNKFLHKNDHILFIENRKKSQVTSIEKQTSFFSLFISTKVLSVNRSTFKESSTFVSLDITQESSFVSRNTEEEIIFESRIENSKFFDLSTLSRETQNKQKVDERILSTQITSIVDRSSSKTSVFDNRLIHQTLTRVQTSDQASRDRIEKHFFQSSHLANLRELLIFHIYISASFTISTANTSEVENRFNKTLSEKYFENASSIAIHQFNYQSLQSLVQRNFNLLISILSKSQSKLITKHSAESSATSASQIFSISIESHSDSSSLETNQKKDLENDITIVTT